MSLDVAVDVDVDVDVAVDAPEHPSPLPSPPLISVVIVTYQRPEAVVRLLESVRADRSGARPYEVCLVNNGGVSYEDVSELIDVWVDPQENLGASEGRNQGVEATSGELLFFLDDDAVLLPGAAGYIERVFEEPSISAIRGQILPLAHPWFNTLAYFYHQGDVIQPDLMIVEGVNVIRREIYTRAGGYCAHVFGGEGFEFSERIFQAQPNARIEYHPQLKIRHDYVESWGELWRKAHRNIQSVSPQFTEEHIEAHHNLVAAKARYKGYTLLDGRTARERAAAFLINQVFKLFKLIHKLKGARKA